MSQDIIKEFLIDSYEGLDRLELDLVELEKDPDDSERIKTTFRTIHSIKGMCGFLAFNKLEKVAHVGENLLSRMRDGDLLLDRDVATGLLHLVDATRQILHAIETTGAEPETEYAHIVEELTRLYERPAATPAAPAHSAAPVAVPDRVEAAPMAVVAEPRPVEHPVGVSEPAAVASEPIVVEERRAGVADSALRVDVAQLDKLMTLVGELVLARNQILQFTADLADTGIASATQRLNLVTSELQEGVMKTRMQPIGNIWSKFPRVVRDLAAQCGKQVRLEMEGKETDLDKTIIEAIKDPLTHIVRNSVDHGIEAPEVRVAAGKPAEGVIRLRAFHEGGQINIEISDDGGGIDAAKIRAAAVRKGVVTKEIADRLSDHDAIRLIFLPGFSTAEKVSNISGRGVGMDVVKTNIENIGGQVDMQSRLGEGTVLKVKIPLTLAIIPALMVSTAEGSRYAIPQVSLLELVRIEAEQAATAIEWITDAPFYRLRGQLLPLVYLGRELNPSAGEPAADAVVNIVIVKADDRQFGLIVDAIGDTEEIVVKPLGKQLKRSTVFAGATVMGDGTVALILDVLGIAQRVRVVSETRTRSVSDSETMLTVEGNDDRQTLLLFTTDGSNRMAMPLSLVARLEEFPARAIERSNGQALVQYRGEIMPLVTVGAMAADDTARTSRQVIVLRRGDRHVGLLVDHIVDIVTDRIVVERPLARPGVLGSAILQQRVTELLDIKAVLNAAEPRRLQEAA